LEFNLSGESCANVSGKCTTICASIDMQIPIMMLNVFLDKFISNSTIK
jgi:hypothetical protein